MKFSYSKVQTYDSCPYKFKLIYIDKLKPIPDTRPDNALYLGTACHTGIEERSIDKAIESYKSNYNEITLANEIEIEKLKVVLDKAIKQIPNGKYELGLYDDDGFVGYIDCLVPVGDNEYDILDFKYSNNVSSYVKSPQIHLYKYYFEKQNDAKINHIGYVFIPKCQVKLDESLQSIEDYKTQIREDLENKNICIQYIDYDQDKIAEFMNKKLIMENGIANEVFDKKYSVNCKWCEFADYCKTKGKDKTKIMEESNE